MISPVPVSAKRDIRSYKAFDATALKTVIVRLVALAVPAAIFLATAAPKVRW